MTSSPRTLGGYELLLPIGRGGMGTVHLARRQVVDGVTRLYALKRINASVAEQARAAEDLLAEARIAAQIRHRNVVEVVEAGEERGIVFLVMEYVEGTTLGGLLQYARERGEPLAVSTVGRIALDAVAGLAAAHQAKDAEGRLLNVIHRDFSPQNLLVGIDGSTRLTDFGIAKAISRRSDTATGLIKGKLRYMAPEQVDGTGLDARSDLWAVGAVLWEALVGRPLFDADHDATVLLEIVSGPPPPRVSLYRGHVPEEVDELIARLLQRAPEERFESAQALHVALQEAFAAVVVASDEEVSTLVQTVAGDGLSARSVELGAVTTARTAVMAPPTSGATAPVFSDEPPSAPARPTTRAWMLAGVTALSVGAGYFILDIDAAPEEPRLREKAATASAPQRSPYIDVISDTPVSEIRVGEGPAVVFAEPRSRFQIERPEASARVVARSASGVTIEARVVVGATSLSLSFPPPAPPPPSASPPPRIPVPSPRRATTSKRAPVSKPHVLIAPEP